MLHYLCDKYLKKNVFLELHIDCVIEKDIINSSIHLLLTERERELISVQLLANRHLLKYTIYCLLSVRLLSKAAIVTIRRLTIHCWLLPGF